jgi:hypothetical protein
LRRSRREERHSLAEDGGEFCSLGTRGVDEGFTFYSQLAVCLEAEPVISVGERDDARAGQDLGAEPARRPRRGGRDETRIGGGVVRRPRASDDTTAEPGPAAPRLSRSSISTSRPQPRRSTARLSSFASCTTSNAM